MKKLFVLLFIMLIMPIKVLAVTPMVEAGYEHVISLRSDGTVWTWGRNTHGQLGIGTTVGTSNPVQVKGPGGVGYLTDIISISTGADGCRHAAALKSDGTVWTWGDNGVGQLGIGVAGGTRTTPVQVVGLTDVIDIDVGDSFMLALRSDRTVWAWGNNTYGFLGDGTSGGGTNKASPVQVLGPGEEPFLIDIIAISAGDHHSAALKSDGTVYTWGYNAYGQLGDNTIVNKSRPVQVVGPNIEPYLIDIIAISVDGGGVGHSAALKSDGTVWTWGNNEYGRLGDGTTINSRRPVQYGAGLITDVKFITVGWNNTLAIKKNGTVWISGLNNYGQLGVGEIYNWSTTPVQVLGPNGVGELTNAISATIGNGHLIILKSDGTMWTCGLNSYGQLGISTGENLSNLTQVMYREASTIGSFTSANKIAAGRYHNVVIRNDKTVWTWGDNENGQLGNGTTVDSITPIQVNGLTDVIAVSAGAFYTAALKDDGTVWTWGLNNHGQLGNGTTEDSTVPVQVSGLTNVVSISAGGYHGLAIKNDGTMWAWGLNNYGQLGNNSTDDSTVPIQVNTNVISISAGFYHTVAAKSDGTVWTSGINTYGLLGNGTGVDSLVPVQVEVLTDVTTVATRGLHTLALKSDGTVWAWGYNYYGQLGNGETTDSEEPVQVSGLTNVTTISAGYYHNIVLKSDGTVWTWGYNYYGQLGDNSTTNRTTPVRVRGVGGVGYISNVIYISAGEPHTVAVKNDGTIWAWGGNAYGQLGNGNISNTRTPVQVVEDAEIEMIPTFLMGSDELSNEHVYGTYDDDRKNFKYFIGKDSNGNPKIMLVSKTGKSKDFSRDDILDAEGKFRWGIYYIGRKGTIGVYGPTN